MIDMLPVKKIIPELKSALESKKCAVLQAPPGAGKTTYIPLALLDAPWLKGKNILMLEPRKLAASASAGRMADMLGEPVGKTVGYHIRMERKIGPETRIEVITEGILTRRIQSDPSLEKTGLVIFDEFHERNINSDLGLALCLESFEDLRKDLRLLIMSATMDIAPVSALMGNAPIIVSEGKSFPVETKYIPALAPQKNTVLIEKACYFAAIKTLSEETGDILVFLPGVKEIKRLELMLNEKTDPEINVLPLYGNLSRQAQAAAIFPSLPGKRKIVLATSIAETSITIEGVRVVIDSGLMRVPRFFSGTGMSRLETIPVSKASADQRRGRAGRVSAGMCYRLWSEQSHHLLKPFNTPEILCTELAGFTLELAAWGVSEPEDLKWLDLPPQESIEQARTLLKNLGALDEKGRITSHGKKLSAAGVHPRLGHMIIEGEKTGDGLLACRIAALINERDFLSFRKGEYDADIRSRLEIIESVIKGRNFSSKDIKINRGIVYRIIQTADKLKRNLKIQQTKINIEKAGSLLAYAYPERIAKNRNSKNNSFLMASGNGAFFLETGTLSFNDYIVAASLDGNLQNARIYLAAPYSQKALELDFGHLFKKEDRISWDKKIGAIHAKRNILYGKLLVSETPIADIDPEIAGDIMIKTIGQQGLEILPWTQTLISLRERTVFLKNSDRFPDLPDLSNAALEAHMGKWLKPFLAGVSSLNQLKKIDLKSAITTMLTWEQRQVVEIQAPTHITVPSGSKKPLTYRTKEGSLESPVLAVRLQEMFGLTATPKIAGGEIPVTLHLLSPAGRPMQITKDLESFWKTTYQDVKKDLMGRYPKHYWPDKPVTAQPTSRTKPRKKGGKPGSTSHR
jgi:ATP-dependent helicase HrpB